MPYKLKKPREQKIVEEYFPVSEKDVKYSIEKEYKKNILNEEKEKEIKTRTKKKSKKKTYSPPKINLKKGGYELIITEKPQAALKISSALGNPSKKNYQGVPYYEVSRDGKKIIVACTVGHLLTLKQNVSGSNFPVFDVSWVPNYLAIKKDFTKKYYQALSKLAKDAGSITIATDYDIEGEVIGLNAVRYICGQKDASRMKFSTLTPSELNKAYENKSSTLNWGQAIAGETRHYLDWFYGINLSRALMNSIKATGKFKIMSIGRVQGPTLNLIVQKEKKIQDFKSKPYWQVFIQIRNSHELELKYDKDIFDKKQIKKFENLKGQKALAETKKTEQRLPPNPPFNLTALQIEAYRIYGITPTRTLQIAQSLYLAGLISYPRTSSQKLPDSVSYKEILKKLSKKYKVEKLITKNKPIQGKQNDPAHPSIYPTGQNETNLLNEEQKIYDLIVKRFLALFCDDAIIEKKKIIANVNKLSFSAKGSAIRKKSWLGFYPAKLKEQEIPDVQGQVEIINVRTKEKQTQPPKRYTQASIISELEKRNLGTKATRASIIETLYDRGYIKEKSIQATPLGISLINTLEKYSPIIIEEELTRKFEKDMEKIEQSKNDFEEKGKKVIENAKKSIIKISKDFEENEEKIGKELVKANEKLRQQQKEENKLNICPICKKGTLIITYSKKNKRYFIACDAYPRCKTTFSLPPNSLIKKTEKNCEECGFPMLMSIKKGKKPWVFCFNPRCPTNKERLEEYRKKKEVEKATTEQ